MTTDLSLFTLIINASFIVKLVLALLILISIISWTIILDRERIIARARWRAKTFEERFWSGGDLGMLYTELSQESDGNLGLAALFRAGFKEFLRLRKLEDLDLIAVIQGAERSMRVALSRELDRLETNLPLLATIGSTSPYIGLFGTVWGIMQAFHALGNVEQATLALVAPGISESLIATAIGLFAAIPAVIGYNRYAHQVERLQNRYQEFLEEFSTLLQRQGRN